MNEEWNNIKWKLLGIFLFLIVFGYVLKLVCVPADIAVKTFDADNIIYNYEWFHQTYSDIKATKVKIANANLNIKQAKTNEAIDKWQTIRNGLSNYLQDLISQYNARSKMLNRKLFKSKNLPYRFEFNGLKIKEIQ